MASFLIIYVFNIWRSVIEASKYILQQSIAIL